jgi:hypothetical protein
LDRGVSGLDIHRTKHEHTPSARAEVQGDKHEAAAGKTQRVFLAECRGIPLPTPSALDPDASKGQFSNEAEAKASCPSDAVVWANLHSKIYHASNSKSYGATRSGAYMCEHASAAAGFRAAKPFVRAAAAQQ